MPGKLVSTIRKYSFDNWYFTKKYCLQCTVIEVAGSSAVVVMTSSRLISGGRHDWSSRFISQALASDALYRYCNAIFENCNAILDFK